MIRSANLPPTVDGFITMLTAKITQYDQRKSLKDPFHNSNFMGLAFESVEDRITSKFRKAGLLNSSDPEALLMLKALIPTAILIKAVTGTVVRAIDAYLENGKIPKYPGRRPRGSKRKASEVIHDLEIRIAHLEKESSSPVFELEGHIHEGSEGDYYVRKRGGIKEITSYIESWSNRVLIAEEGNWEIKYDYKHFFGFTASNGLTELELFCVEGECRSEVRQLELLLRKVLLIPRSVRTDFNK